MSIIQGSPEWLEAKKSKIGASEIYSLVYHYCFDELVANGLNLAKDRPFVSIQELFLKIKFGAKMIDINPVFAEFGNGMERYIVDRVDDSLGSVEPVGSREFIVNDNLHPLASCSPDGYVEVIGDASISDFDGLHQIDNSWGRGALELKTANYFANFDADKGPKLQYIFQHQYQMMVLGLKWGILSVLMPKEEDYDSAFFKGRILEKAENKKDVEIHQYYELVNYVYPGLPVFQKMIVKALESFQNDLDAYDTDQSVFPRNSEDLTALQREKRMWGELWPTKFGILEVGEENGGDNEINYLLNQRHEAKIACMFSDQELLKIDNSLRQKCGKYTEVIGSEHRMVWTSNGQSRFYKRKN